MATSAVGAVMVIVAMLIAQEAAGRVAAMVGQGLVRAKAYADEHARAAVLQAAVQPTEPADVTDLEVAVSYTQSRVLLEPGDILVMYTDGLVEGRSRDLETGIASAQRLVERWSSGTDLADGCRAHRNARAGTP